MSQIKSKEKSKVFRHSKGNSNVCEVNKNENNIETNKFKNRAILKYQLFLHHKSLKNFKTSKLPN